MIIFKLHKL